jgi:gluconolactonase
VIRVNPHGDITVLADSHEGRRLNSPNDLVYRSDGTLFFTDPPFGLPDGFDDPDKELDFSGAFALGPVGLAVIDDSLEGPNGIAFSPDERYLSVGNWDLEHKVVVRYELATGERRILADLTREPGEDAIDGIQVDPSDGHLFVCGPGGVWILSPAGGRLGLLKLPEDPHSLALGRR